jgi:hypothetical protein
VQYLQTLRVAYARASLNLVRSNLLAVLSDVITADFPTRRTRNFVDLQFGGFRCWRWEPQPQDAVVLHERRQEPDSIHTHFPRELSIVGRPCFASTCICSPLTLSGMTAHTA